MTTTALARKHEVTSLSFGPFVVTRVGLVLEREPTWEEWERFYDAIEAIEDASNWCIGDAEAFTRPKYGEAAEQLTANWPEYQYDKIRNDRWVSEKVEFATRVANLSWTHHREVARLEPPEQRHWLALAIANNWDSRELRQKIREANPPGKPPQIPGEYEVIAIDPPWPYGTAYDPEGRRAASPYPEIALEALAEMKLPAAQDCILWLWTTHAFMRAALALLDTWEFREVAILTWVKDRMGLGQWLRSQSEFCIMAVKGTPRVNLSNQTTVLNGPMREHSRKPDEFYQLVEGLVEEEDRKADIFGREQRNGWDVFGNEPEKFQSKKHHA